jgi:predicted RecB family nuclease
MERTDAAKSWVSKTNVASYYRCPYAFWLVDRGQVRPEDALSPLASHLIADGNAFHEAVAAAAPPLALPPGGLGELFKREDLTLYGPLPTFRNQGLRLLGAPDAIEMAGGALFPIEVKSHAKPTALDRLELAFYWVLLAPARTSFPAPEGRLVLRGAEDSAPVRVPLLKEDFAEVHRLIAAVRTARAEGVEPRLCRCQVCSGRPEVGAASATRRDLGMIFGINSTYAAALESLGCHRYDELASLDPVATVAGFRARKLFISPGVVEHWQLHARAYAEGRPVLLPAREPLPALRRYIALDMEWGLDGRIWLAGAGFVHKDGTIDHFRWWADDEKEEWTALAGLAAFLVVNPDVRVVTWNGKGADVPRLRDRCAALGVDDLVASVEARHVDLYLWAQNWLRLPVPTLGLKELGRAFGFAKASSVGSGMEAMALYFQYQEATSPKVGAKLRQQLEAYNDDDVASLAHVAGHLVALDAASPRPLPLAG